MARRSRRNVAIVTPWYPTPAQPGLGSFVREHARALATAADVVVIHADAEAPSRRKPWTIAATAEDGLRTFRVRVGLPHVRGVGLLLFATATRTALRRLARDGWRPDVLHAHVASAGLLALAARPRAAATVITEHYSGFARGTVTGSDLRLARFAYAHADLVCPVSENLAGHLRRKGVKTRLQVMPNPIDTSRFRPGARQRDSGPVRALLAAGLTEVKQVPVLLEALAITRSRKSEPEIVLDVAGDGPLLDDLRRHAQALGLGSQVRWLGRQDPDAVAELMRASDLVVLSSRWENLPTVLLEAMASGLPVVAPRVGGVPEIVDEEAGVLVESGDVAALADALTRVAGRLGDYDPDRLHSRAVELYGFEAVTKRWLTVYDELT